MRRIVTLFVLAAVAAFFHSAAPAAADDRGVADPAPIVGQVVDSATGLPVGGTTLQLHVDAGGAPGGAVGDPAVTNANGEFSLTPPAAAVDYWVEVVRNAKIQGGYVSDSADGPSWVQFNEEYATPVRAGARLGRVLGVPSFISGVVVNAANGNRLRGIRVSTRDVHALGTVLDLDTTDANGFFRLPIWGEDFGLRVNGRARGFENGWRACNGTVVRTWGAACGSPIGRIGRVKLDRL